MKNQLEGIDREITTKYLNKHCEIILCAIALGKLSPIKKSVLKAAIESDTGTTPDIAQGFSVMAVKSVLSELEKEGWLVSIPSGEPAKDCFWLSANENISCFLRWCVAEETLTNS